MPTFRKKRWGKGRDGMAVPARASQGGRSLLIRLVIRLAREDGGQDLIEYALLSAAIAIVSVLVFPSIVTKMGNGFSAWGTSIQSLWIPNDP